MSKMPQHSKSGTQYSVEPTTEQNDNPPGDYEEANGDHRSDVPGQSKTSRYIGCAFTWAKDQSLIVVAKGPSPSAYPSSRDWVQLSRQSFCGKHSSRLNQIVLQTETEIENSAPSNSPVVYLQIAWSLIFTNSLRDFIFLGHPTGTRSPSRRTSITYSHVFHGTSPSAAHSWKDPNTPFDPRDYTQYPTTYSTRAPHLPYIRRDNDSRLCLSCDDPRILSNNGYFHLNRTYVHELTEFSQQACDSLVPWKALGIRWDVEMVPELHGDILVLQGALTRRYETRSSIEQKVHNILLYSYEVIACRTLYFYRTLHEVLGGCRFVYGVEDSLVGTVLEHPLPSQPWVAELMRHGVPIFGVKSEVWRRLDNVPNGQHKGNDEHRYQERLRSILNVSQVHSIRVCVPSPVQNPTMWRIMPPWDASEVPIEDRILQMIKHHSDSYLEPYLSDTFEELLWELQQVLGSRIKNFIPDPELSKVCLIFSTQAGTASSYLNVL